ncbi:sigma-70 family RNA polymerase sigma factor [Roseateles oligotrophus]|uniref:Sigma-70 family RNA polymerase sigma factor n=1 Tax=Roseateles oligotrophus TaxID=1769250 RepID=A0ABT2YDY1_9BURK|nr:sigma-70 family RNA polymerase sigma factor [Roseateles oligotrophus]MCV2368229.1 sigma-70 family RNA polymerase sigma factor [Roseateles oligotrophus]
MTIAPIAEQDIAETYQSLRRALLAYLRGKVGDAATAEDLLHEVFLKALAAGQKGAVPSNMSAWLYAIARNAVIDHYRSRRIMDELPEDLVDEGSDDADAELAGQALAACLLPVTKRLPALYRDTLLATDFEGRSLQSLADDMQISLSAVKSRASRGRKLLRASLLACCQLELAASGMVLDFRPRRAEGDCSPAACGSTRAPAAWSKKGA